MKFLLMAFTFFAGVYLGLHADADSELRFVIEQVQAVIHGEPAWDSE
jgi:hypothetical protein